MTEEHTNCVKQPEFTRYVQLQADYQKAQNGSIQRIEGKVDTMQTQLTEIYLNQRQFIQPFLDMYESEVEHRQCGDADLSRRVSYLEFITKVPGWTWKAVAAILGLAVAVLTVLALTGVI